MVIISLSDRSVDRTDGPSVAMVSAATSDMTRWSASALSRVSAAGMSVPLMVASRAERAYMLSAIRDIDSAIIISVIIVVVIDKMQFSLRRGGSVYVA